MAGTANNIKQPGETAEQPVQVAGAAADSRPGAGEDCCVTDPAATESAPPETSELDRLRQEIESLHAKLAEQQDLALRARAELDNFRKRTARDVENAYRFALERFIGELLPVMDSIELGMDAAQCVADSVGLREGMDLTRRKFLDTLERFGVTILNPLGQKFDPERHEAISMQEAEGTDPGTVLVVMLNGYELNGRLLRPARVVVAKVPATE